MEALSQLASMPDHPVWVELEKYYRARITQGERQQIVGVVQEVLSQQPDVDLNELVLKVTQSILQRRQMQRY